MTGNDPALDRLHEAALTDLHEHWGTAYWVQLIDDETWVASPFAEPGTLLRAGTAAELRTLIRRDYDARTLPKEVPEPPG